MRRCKKCRKLKSHVYLTVNTQGRSVYKDATGEIWHGRICGGCQADIVKEKADKVPLTDGVCASCGIVFTRKVINKKFCCSACRLDSRSRRSE